MTYEEALILSNELKGRFDHPFTPSDKITIERLYQDVLNKRMRRTNCQQCYHDALIEIYLYLKNNKTMAQKSKYTMRAGFIIKSPMFHDGKIFTNTNLTDEVAEEYIAMFPNKAHLFDVTEEPKKVEETPTEEEKPVEKPKKNRKKAKK